MSEGASAVHDVILKKHTALLQTFMSADIQKNVGVIQTTYVNQRRRYSTAPARSHELIYLCVFLLPRQFLRTMKSGMPEK